MTEDEICPECGQADNCGDCTHDPAVVAAGEYLVIAKPHPRVPQRFGYAGQYVHAIEDSDEETVRVRFVAPRSREQENPKNISLSRLRFARRFEET